MNDPYDVLGIPRGSGDAEVRRRYLELVRENPPDRAAERFAEIRRAYEQLRDPVVRMESRLFDLESAGTMTQIVAEARRRLRRCRIPTKVLLSLGDEP
jgi:DnaJ-class molecular chaperone